MLIFDTETTGLTLPRGAPLDQQPHIIELGIIRLDDDYNEVDRYSQLVNPTVPLDEEVHAKITGLKNADLEDQPTFAELLYDVAEFWRGEDRVICHNAPFDMSLLVYELQRIGAEFAFPYPVEQFCTAQWSEAHWGRRHKMNAMYERVMGTKLDQTHRAIEDAEALAQIVRKLRL